jgi:hypothetical protein
VWPFHIREYTPAQLRGLCARFGQVTMWKGTPDGDEVHPILHPTINDVFNRARALPMLEHIARGVNLVVPSKAKIHSHLAIRIRLADS